VVNVASIHAEVTKAGFAAYSTTKGALVALTRALALELAPAVRVNAILPAATDTAMLRAGFAGNQDGFAALDACHPLGRIARPDEIAALAAFLGSSQSGFLTGEAIRVDGGIGAVLHDPVAIPARVR
jgi:NAD(P)-dependent dehydrogenase (short-subunit alcohol dehydrogenase family)